MTWSCFFFVTTTKKKNNWERENCIMDLYGCRQGAIYSMKNVWPNQFKNVFSYVWWQRVDWLVVYIWYLFLILNIRTFLSTSTLNSWFWSTNFWHNYTILKYVYTDFQLHYIIPIYVNFELAPTILPSLYGFFSNKTVGYAHTLLCHARKLNAQNEQKMALFYNK